MGKSFQWRKADCAAEKAARPLFDGPSVSDWIITVACMSNGGDSVPDMDKVYEFLERIGPVCAAWFATGCIVFVLYMVFVDWREKKERWYLSRIEDLETLLKDKDKQLNASLLKQCDMAYELNEIDGKYKICLDDAKAAYEKQLFEANARAEGNKKRADDMAAIAEEFRRKAERVA